MRKCMQQDDIYFEYPVRVRVEGATPRIDVVEGDRVRDYGIRDGGKALFPYNLAAPSEVLDLPRNSAAYAHFLKYRILLDRRTSVGFKTIAERGMAFYEYAFYYPQ